MLRALVLGVAVAAALALYFFLTWYVFPQSYQLLEPRRPEAVVTDVRLSTHHVAPGQSLVISVTGANRGEQADMQIVSVGFPNFTRSDSIKVLQHNFSQTPVMIDAGEQVGSDYGGAATPVNARYASVEAFSRPWESGRSYSIDLQVEPEVEGRFAIFVKSVAFPHSWEGAHWPAAGAIDYQKEFIQVYDVEVTKP